MIVLGIDPGYALVGFGVLNYENNKVSVVDYGIIETQKTTSFPKRLKQIGESIDCLVDKYNVDELAIEKLFFNTNTTTAIAVAEARGVIIYSAEVKNVDTYEYTPLQIKQALTGYGRAEKFQIQQMVKTLLNLKEVPKPDDTADAIAVALCHIQTGKFTNDFKAK